MYRKLYFSAARSLKLKVNSTWTHISISREAILRAKSVRWSQCKLASSAGNNDKSVVVRDLFEQVTDKNKQTYLDMVKIFESRGIHRRGHVEFIYSAMKHMEEFGVEKELEVYKALIDVLPKGRFIPTNIFQAEFMHYPKQQQCVIDVLEKMENNGVIPDLEMEDILVNIFGRKGHPVRKYWRMMYWMPKFKNISPWPLPRPVPQDSQLLARLALTRMSSVDLQTNIRARRLAGRHVGGERPKSLTEETTGRSPTQRTRLRGGGVPGVAERSSDVSSLRDPFSEEGAGECVPPTVHEQDDGTILAMCATGTSSRDSLLSWVRLLERDGNPALGHVPVLFKLQSPLGELATLEEDQTRIQAPGCESPIERREDPKVTEFCLVCVKHSPPCVDPTAKHFSSSRIALRDAVFGTSVSANTPNTLAPFSLSSDTTVRLPTPVGASRAARDRNTAAAGESGSWATQLCPFSPHAPTRESSGKHPRKGTRASSARELPPPLEKILVHSCKRRYVGHTKPLMFSRIPRMGIPVLRQKVISFLTSSMATFWGVVTITAPSQFNSLKHDTIITPTCNTAERLVADLPFFLGPRQTTPSFLSLSKNPIDMTASLCSLSANTGTHL
uniref:Evolutionarily conserved signaling intermediate in Toll pathway, mitochondrial n=1 Tax=Timema poppense TaxID=170557 RepID=A0A7R9DK85_TIMPO|nr:unnamed protein product [Timema poppensis]